ncbi:MAG: HD domain-containing protein [Ruminococcus sp.]|nr:HD domain-containing protein [Ruminococcus sp.]
MAEIYYGVTFMISMLLTLFYIGIWHKHFDAHMTVMFILIPINQLGYWLYSTSETLGEAIMAQKIVYIGGSYMPLMILLMILGMCRIELKRWATVLLYVVSTGIFLSAMSIGRYHFFYGDVKFKIENGTPMLYNKEYGFMHTVFYGVIVTYFAISIIVIVYSYFRKNQVSRRILYLLFMPDVVATVSFFGGRKLIDRIELIPAAYAFAQLTYLIIIYRISVYDVDDTAVDSLVERGDTGFITCDFRFRYLGSNDIAKEIFPSLNKLTVDKSMKRDIFIKSTMMRWLDAFKRNGEKNTTYFVKGDKTYLVSIGYLFDGRRRRGYQLVISDDTKNQKYIRLINSFNDKLRTEVEQKTQHIVEMHNKLILSMATMVESRDNSTGGHIKRTSEGVRILIEELRKDEDFVLDEKFCQDIIKAAPMHDLGKIAVDDAILRKPGRFKPEEFEVMKTHAAEGARIVHEILEGTDDKVFQRIAENVAHYHHERWDGSGYPEGLKGEAIPLEARIMAIADVYDALVSKRVYKESMSFEQADKIIMEGMGKHFDKSLEKSYVAARPKLEAYYSTVQT